MCWSIQTVQSAAKHTKKKKENENYNFKEDTISSDSLHATQKEGLMKIPKQTNTHTHTHAYIHMPVYTLKQIVIRIINKNTRDKSLTSFKMQIKHPYANISNKNNKKIKQKKNNNKFI